MNKQKSTYCRICEPMCPLLAEVDSTGDVVGLKPNFDHPAGGVACHKGLSYLEIHNDPDRLNYPLRRRNSRNEAKGDFERIDWETAFTEAGAKLKSIVDKHGPNSVAVYSGNPLAWNNRLVNYIGEFTHLLGTQMTFSASTQDMSNKVVNAIAMYGTTTLIVPDVANTDYLLCLGANPRVSKWTIMSTPNDSGKTIENIKSRGGKVCFVNPRKTESSISTTGETLLIKPATDVYFLAAVLNEIEVLGGFDEKMLSMYGNNVGLFKAYIKKYPAERVTNITGISVADINTVAADIVAAKSATIYISTGVNQSRQGVICHWLSEMLNFATGNLGRKGGSYQPSGYSDYYHKQGLNDQVVNTSLGDFYLPKPTGYMVMPGAVLADLIDSGDIKALICVSGNPLLSVGGESKMRDAFKKLEVMVTVDFMRNATGELSDYILPGTDFLERADSNQGLDGTDVLPKIMYTDAVVKPKAERKDEWKIISRLTEEMGLRPEVDDPDGFAGVNKMLGRKGISLQDVKELPYSTLILPATRRDDFFEKCLKHDDKRINCFPPEFEEAGLFKRCESIFEELQSEPNDSLKLISRRTPFMHNSWFANVPSFRSGTLQTNPLNMCSQDAASKGLLDGDNVRVFNKNGSVITRLTITDDLRQGVVSLTHGYGGGRPSMRTAERNPGVNCNQLMPTGLDSYEPLSYMSWLCGVPVDIELVD